MMVVNVVFLFFISPIITIINAQGSPTISHVSQTQIRDTGDTVDLSCSVLNIHNYSVSWMKVDKADSENSVSISVDSFLILQDSRLSIRHDPENSTHVLQIRNIINTDAGTYSCQVILSSSNKISADVELQVRPSPFITDNSTKSVSASEGEDVEMECYAGGFPTSSIYWRRENDALLPTNGKLIYRGNKLKIESIRKVDRGIYYCVAKFGNSQTIERSIPVTIGFAPVVTVPKPRVGQVLGYDINLECDVSGYPLPNITWIKDGVTLSTSGYYRISQYSFTEYGTEATFRIYTVEKKNYGQYFCKAENMLGSSEGRVILFESTYPEHVSGGWNEMDSSGAIVSTSTTALCIALLICFYRNLNIQP